MVLVAVSDQGTRMTSILSKNVSAIIRELLKMYFQQVVVFSLPKYQKKKIYLFSNVNLVIYCAQYKDHWAWQMHRA